MYHGVNIRNQFEQCTYIRVLKNFGHSSGDIRLLMILPVEQRV